MPLFKPWPCRNDADHQARKPWTHVGDALELRLSFFQWFILDSVYLRGPIDDARPWDPIINDEKGRRVFLRVESYLYTTENIVYNEKVRDPDLYSCHKRLDWPPKPC